MARASVLLPHPLWPTRPNTSPGDISSGARRFYRDSRQTDEVRGAGRSSVPCHLGAQRELIDIPINLGSQYDRMRVVQRGRYG